MRRAQMSSKNSKGSGHLGAGYARLAALQIKGSSPISEILQQLCCSTELSTSVVLFIFVAKTRGPVSGASRAFILFSRINYLAATHRAEEVGVGFRTLKLVDQELH